MFQTSSFVRFVFRKVGKIAEKRSHKVHNVEAAGIRAKGVKKWAKGFTQPVAIITPINILEIFIRPFSLCLRLFGNVLGAFVIMELIKAVVPMVVPLVFSFYFDIFDGLIQAYVFVFLTSLYIKEAIELQAE